MAQVIPLAFNNKLVRAMERQGEPWFVGRDVCDVLEIKNSRDALDRVDDDERGVANADTLGGVQEVVIVSEPGVYRLVFTSRKPEAEAFKRWLAHEVLPQLRKTGRFAPQPAPEPALAPGADAALTLQNWRLAAVKEARLLFGQQRAARLWDELGLPKVPAPPSDADANRECLDLLLDATHFDRECSGVSLREHLRLIFAIEDEDAAQALAKHGLRCVFEDEQGILVANGSDAVERAYAGTRWVLFRWVDALRRIPGIKPHGVAVRFGRDTHRASFIPLRLILTD